MKESLCLAEQFDVAGLAVGVVAVLLERAFVEELEAECTGEVLRVPLLPHCCYTLACRGGGGGRGKREGERDRGGGREGQGRGERGKRDRGRGERGTGEGGGGGGRGRRDRGRGERGTGGGGGGGGGGGEGGGTGGGGREERGGRCYLHVEQPSVQYIAHNPHHYIAYQ